MKYIFLFSSILFVSCIKVTRGTYVGYERPTIYINTDGMLFPIVDTAYGQDTFRYTILSPKGKAVFRNINPIKKQTYVYENDHKLRAKIVSLVDPISGSEYRRKLRYFAPKLVTSEK